MNALRKKLDIPPSKNAEKEFKRPFLLLGYGLNSYFNIVYHLIKMMSIMMIVTVPLMMFYASQEDLSTLPGYEFNAMTLGNIGGASSVCAVSTFHSEEMVMPIKCRSGLLNIDATSKNTGKPIFDFGIIPASSQVITYCANSSF